MAEPVRAARRRMRSESGQPVQWPELPGPSVREGSRLDALPSGYDVLAHGANRPVPGRVSLTLSRDDWNEATAPLQPGVQGWRRSKALTNPVILRRSSTP